MANNVFSRWWLRRKVGRALVPLTQVRTVMVLCTANMVRSPFAEAALRRHLPEGVTVQSRGVLDSGKRVPGEAIEAARAHDIDLSAHRSQRVQPGELLQADLLLPMELRQAHDIVVRFPSLVHRVVPLRFFDPEGSALADVDDPFMLPPSEYREAYDTIMRCCAALGAQLTAAHARLADHQGAA